MVRSRLRMGQPEAGGDGRGAARHALRGIALANTMYCMITAGCLYCFRASLTVGDWLYFPGEIVLIGTLVALELQVALAATTGRSVTAR